MQKAAAYAKIAREQGYFIVQRTIGGYMYLRSLIGPEELLYAFYDNPELIHSCMHTWFQLADKVCAEHQKQVSFDELFLAEDICYNGGCLISPDMMREFLFPYYQQLIAKGGDDIKRHLDSIMPFMRKRGGFIPTCDHGVPEETSFENYMLYRALMSDYCS